MTKPVVNSLCFCPFISTYFCQCIRWFCMHTKQGDQTVRKTEVGRLTDWLRMIDLRRSQQRQRDRNAPKIKTSIQFVTKYYWCRCCAKQKTLGNSFIAKRDSLASIGIWILLAELCCFCSDSWCNSQIVALVSLTHLGPIYKRSSPHWPAQDHIALGHGANSVRVHASLCVCEGLTSVWEVHTGCFAALWGHQYSTKH